MNDSVYRCFVTCNYQNMLAFGTAGAILLTVGIASNCGEAKRRDESDQRDAEFDYKAEFRNNKQAMIFTGNANKALAKEVGDYLGVEMSAITVLIITVCARTCSSA